MIKRTLFSVAYILFLSVVLVACGGGGGTSGNNGPSLSAPDPAVKPTGTAISWSDYRAIMPDGLAIKEDGTIGWVTMVGNNGKPAPDPNYGECRIALANVTNDNNLDLDNLALDTLNAAFLTNLGNNRNIFGDNPGNWSGIFGSGFYPPLEDEYHLRGISGEGWPYVELQGRLQRSGGGARYEDVRILLAQLSNSKYAAMIGYAYNYTLCVGEGANDSGKWINLVYSLSFPGYQAPDPDGLRKKLYGGWFGTYVGRMNTYWGHVFAANGHEQSIEGVSVYTPLGDTGFVYDSSATWAGNGSWRLNNGKLTIWPDNKQPYTNYLRYYESYNKSGNSWDIYIRTLEQCSETINGVTTTANCEKWAVKEQ